MRKYIAFTIAITVLTLILAACSLPATPPPIPTAVPQPSRTAEITVAPAIPFPKADSQSTEAPTSSPYWLTEKDQIVDHDELLPGEGHQTVSTRIEETEKESGWINKITVVLTKNVKSPESYLNKAIDPSRPGQAVIYINLDPVYTELRTSTNLQNFSSRHHTGDDRDVSWEQYIENDVMMPSVKQHFLTQAIADALAQLPKIVDLPTPTPQPTPFPTEATSNLLVIPDGFGTMYIENPSVSDAEARQIDAAIARIAEQAKLSQLRILIFGKNYLSQGFHQELNYSSKQRDIILVVYERPPSSRLIISNDLKSSFENAEKDSTWQHQIESELASQVADGHTAAGIIEALKTFLQVPGMLPSSNN